MRAFGKNNMITGLLSLALVLASTSALADRDRGRGWGHRHHDHDRDRVSINVNVGRPYYGGSWHRGHRAGPSWGYGVGFGSFGSQIFFSSWGNPYSSWDYYDRRPVVVEKNIYIEHSSPSNRVTTRAITRSSTSLFRDRYGRCYERERDSFGNETRIELDPSECNF